MNNNRYNQGVSNNETRFNSAPLSDLEFSTINPSCTVTTSFNAGDIVPVVCDEVLPHETYKLDLNFVIRQTTSVVPVMGNMFADIYAFFVPNRVVNQSWKNVQGENSSGSWIAPDVNLCPLGNPSKLEESVKVPIGSVADYYGYPTQYAIPNTVLVGCHDFKFRGYLEIYNNYFRDQNYQPPIPYSKLNVYNGFLESAGTVISPVGSAGFDGAVADGSYGLHSGEKADGSYANGAIIKALVGDGGSNVSSMSYPGRLTAFSALGKPLKANKIHDYFTSSLPSPQKGPQVTLSLGDKVPLNADDTLRKLNSGIKLGDTQGNLIPSGQALRTGTSGYVVGNPDNVSVSPGFEVVGATSLYADLSQATAISIDAIRESIALQQVYETLARGGSRYFEFINSFFGLDIDNPFDDIPTYLGHFRRELDLYQTAQTSASTETSPQGNLSAFGYTANGGSLFTHTFNEHGYVHVFCVVRHRNLYSSLLTRDNFRMSMMDFYLPQLANLSEQPTYTKEINPFLQDPDGIFGYREAWAEYRYMPDRVTGAMRVQNGTGQEADSIAFWNYADNFDNNLKIADADFLQSNSEEILNRSLAVDSSLAPQFKGQFIIRTVKEMPMPVYSIPGLDIF